MTKRKVFRRPCMSARPATHIFVRTRQKLGIEILYEPLNCAGISLVCIVSFFVTKNEVLDIFSSYLNISVLIFLLMVIINL